MPKPRQLAGSSSRFSLSNWGLGSGYWLAASYSGLRSLQPDILIGEGDLLALLEIAALLPNSPLVITFILALCWALSYYQTVLRSMWEVASDRMVDNLILSFGTSRLFFISSSTYATYGCLESLSFLRSDLVSLWAPPRENRRLKGCKKGSAWYTETAVSGCWDSKTYLARCIYRKLNHYELKVLSVIGKGHLHHQK